MRVLYGLFILMAKLHQFLKAGNPRF